MGGVFSKKNDQGDSGSEKIGQILKEISNLEGSSMRVSDLRGWQI
jgi:hypothetical protein